MKQTNKSAVGTSFHGHTIKATVNELKKILGKPVFSENDGTDKVNFEWNMETSSGDVFSVYDWKEYRPLNAEEIISWHIGGKKPSVTELAQTEVEAALKSAAATPSPLPETGKKVVTKDGEILTMNEAETEVMYKGEWCSIQEDQDGEFYFLSGGKVFYIEMPESDPSIEELEKDLWNQPTGAPPTGKTETGVSIDTPTEADGVGDYRPETPETGAKYYNYPHLYESLTPGNERQDSGEGLPETIDVHSTGLFEFKAELHPINDPDGMQVLADVSTLNFAEELAKRYNNYPAMYRALKKWLEIINRSPAALHHYGEAISETETILNSITGGK